MVFDDWQKVQVSEYGLPDITNILLCRFISHVTSPYELPSKATSMVFMLML